jgi:lipoyl(octanoyl) transferase
MPELHPCEFRDLGRAGYAEALAIQKALVEQRKQGLIHDQLLIVEHPHVITLGRNGHRENLLANDEVLRRMGIEFHPTDRGGDITYHGPGQIVGYPIFDLREWKRDVVAYVRAIEQVIIDALGEFGIAAGRIEGCTGVWVNGMKVAAIGVHISRWVTSHGFALNHSTDLSYFQYIVPCGITKPVTSMRELGSNARREAVVDALARQFAKHFQFELLNCEEIIS